MTTNLDVILIGGASHVGKTRIAAQLAQRLGWRCVSTDDLGRHPGRPWESPTEAVQEMYQTLSPETLHWLLRIHHQNIWASIEQQLAEARIGGLPIVLEGNALRPELMHQQMISGTRAVCLTAPEALLRDRIWTACGHDQAAPELRKQVRSFLGRSLIDNKVMSEAAQRHGVEVINVANPVALTRWMESLTG